jgi:hypothetical protein
MSTWFYYNGNGERISVTGGQLKGLAKAGLITPETIIETEEGKSAPARKVKGLTFSALADTATKLTITPTDSGEVYGLVAPPPAPSPFTAMMPEAVETPVDDTSKGENPFIAFMSAVMADTFVDAPSETDSPFTAPMSIEAQPTDNPFTATMPTASPAIPQCVSTSKKGWGLFVDFDFDRNIAALRSIGTFLKILLLPIVITVIYVVLSNIGSLNFSGVGRPSVDKKTVATAVEFVEAVLRNKADILDLDHGWSVDDAKKFAEVYRTTALRVYKDGVGDPKPEFKNTCELSGFIAPVGHSGTLRLYAEAVEVDESTAGAHSSLRSQLAKKFKEDYKIKLQELIRLSIEEIEKAGGSVKKF